VSFLKCPTCGLTNLGTASFCVHCSTPLAQLTQTAELADAVQVVEGNRVQQSIPNRHASDEGTGSRELIRELLDREFVRTGKGSFERSSIAEPHGLRPDYHPLAEKALEKVRRAAVPGPVTSQPVSPLEPSIPPSDDSPVVPSVTATITRGLRQSAKRSEKIERIEIDLNQGHLPFDTSVRESVGDQEVPLLQGLVPAPLPSRIRAGFVDALFLGGCLLIFISIIFFIPDFSFFSKASLLGMTAVGAIVFGAYLFSFTALGNQTLGMQYENLRVIGFGGHSPSVGEVALRCLGYYASLGCFSLGFIWAFFDPKGLTWHDRISKTLIIENDSSVVK
jgi:uncharacterized RDD family membrane protein YckC